MEIPRHPGVGSHRGRRDAGSGGQLHAGEGRNEADRKAGRCDEGICNGGLKLRAFAGRSL